MFYSIRNIDEVIGRILELFAAFKLNDSVSLYYEEEFIDIFMNMPIKY